jgi:hypothetical protein
MQTSLVWRAEERFKGFGRPLYGFHDRLDKSRRSFRIYPPALRRQCNAVCLRCL